MGQRGRPKKVIKEEKQVEVKTQETVITENKHFQTQDKILVYKLVDLGYKVKEVKGPSEDRKEKLYIFHDNEQTIQTVKEKLND